MAWRLKVATLFRDVPGAVQGTLDLSSRLKFQLNDLGYEFPHYPVPDGETMDSFLKGHVPGVVREEPECLLNNRH